MTPIEKRIIFALILKLLITQRFYKIKKRGGNYQT